MPKNAKRQLNGLKRTQALLALGFSLVLASHAAASLETAGSLIQPPAIASPVNNTFDTVGQLTTHNPGSNADTLTWDALGRLVAMQRNPTGNGFSWSAVYDGFGRRLQTSYQTITGGTNSGSPLVAQSSYDPDVQFLEAALTVNGTREWLVHGPDLDGGYGDLQGTGGVDAVVNDSTSAATGVFSDIYGHAVATVSGSTVTWNTVRSSGYGPQPGTTALPLDGVHDDSTFFNWHGKYVDGTGYYHLGNRYYDPTSGTFISCDPLGHAASMDLYSAFGGDGINYFDPDGRNASKFAQSVDNTYWQASTDAARGEDAVAEDILYATKPEYPPPFLDFKPSGLTAENYRLAALSGATSGLAFSLGVATGGSSNLVTIPGRIAAGSLAAGGANVVVASAQGLASGNPASLDQLRDSGISGAYFGAGGAALGEGLSSFIQYQSYFEQLTPLQLRALQIQTSAGSIRNPFAPKYTEGLREQYLGRTPGKNSPTGQQVIKQMLSEGKIRVDSFTGQTQFQASDGNWYPLNEADMAHKVDAVTWWNQIGRFYGAKTPEVRRWMLDPANYTLDHYSLNRSSGALLQQTYLPPAK